MKHKEFVVKDHSVSGKPFQLCYDDEFDMWITTPQPAENVIAEYYNSDDYISHTDSKRNLFEMVYHVVRQMSLKRKLRIINNYEARYKRLLDVGCGTGEFLLKALNSDWAVTGVEPNPKARAIANTKINDRAFNAEHLKTLDGEVFDVITLWHVLEHLPDLNAQIEQFKRLLSRKGTLLIAVPNFKSYDAQYYKEYWAAYDVPRHFWHFSSKSIKLLFGKHGFEIVKVLPMFYDSYYVSLLSEKYRTGHLNLLKGFWIGFKSNFKARRTKEYSSHIYILKFKK